MWKEVAVMEFEIRHRYFHGLSEEKKNTENLSQRRQ